MCEIAVVYINYYSEDVLLDSLKSLKRSALYFSRHFSGKKITVFIANNSPSESLDQIKKEYPDARITDNGRNMGFGRAINRILRNVRAGYALMLNPDTQLSENFIYCLYSFLEKNSSYGIAYSKILNPDNSVQPASLRSTPGVLGSVFRLTGLSKIFWKSSFFNSYHRSHKGYDTEQDTDTCSGSCMMIRKDVYDSIGGFDERFFLYGEDLDIARAVRQSGMGIRYMPSCHIIHVKNYSSRDRWLGPLFYFYYSMFLYLAKYSRGIAGIFKVIFGFFFIIMLFAVKVIYNIFSRMTGGKRARLC